MSQKRVFNTNAEHIYVNDVPEYNLDLVNARSIDPAYSFTRNSAATYVGPDGYIKTAAVNQPRFDYDPVTGESLGLLIEEQRTNLFANSSNINSWTKVNATSSLSDVISPDGNSFAYKVTEDSSSGYHGVRLLNYLNIKNYNSYISFFAKAAERSIVFLSVTFVDDFSVFGGSIAYYFDLSNGTFGDGGIGGSAYMSNVKMESYNNGWYRISAYINSSVDSFRRINIVSGTNSTTGSYTGDNSSGFYLWGLQRERVNSFPTSYIPTASSTVTRQPDQLVLNKNLNTQGTFFIESNPTTGTSLVADNGSSSLSISQPTNTYTKSVLYYNTNRTLRMASDDSVPSDFIYTNPQDLNRISLGFNRIDNDNYINGYLKKFSYYSSPLSEDNLRALTGNKVSTFRYGSANIVTDGLVLYLDAGNPSSYPGSGTTWTDLSGNGNNGTLVNGVGYNSLNGGSLVFDGVNDYVNGVPIEPLYFTLSCWFRATGVPSLNDNSGGSLIVSSPQLFGGAIQYGIFYSWSIERIVFITQANTKTLVTSNNSVLRNKWYNVVGTYDGSSRKIFINGDLAIQESYTTNPVYPTSGNRNYQIGRWGVFDFQRYFNGNIAQVSIYNRALTPQEIQQNFNALGGRFGI